MLNIVALRLAGDDGCKCEVGANKIGRELYKYGQLWYNKKRNGPSPSGKAPGFGPDIRRFESCRPSQAKSRVISSAFCLVKID